ncbi:MAG: hypothetical protein LBK67_00900 [Coriobacteriales bacterium]|jgi:hypothetical protein|nr:hypothetical protein [Coriobacteriales bacterium]
MAKRAMTERGTMKRLLAFLLVGVLAFALIGCSTKQETPEPVEEPAVEEPAPVEQKPEPTPSSNAASGFDMSQALGLDETSKDNPAPLGTWVATMKYSTQTSADSLVYVRVTALERDQTKVQSYIDAYNASNTHFALEPLEAEDLEYVVIHYEVYFPDDFPVDESMGILSPEVTFSLTNYDGAGFDRGDGTFYVGLGIGDDISPDIEYDNPLWPGQTFTDGRIAVAMLKGATDLLIETDYFVDNKMHEIFFQS